MTTIALNTLAAALGIPGTRLVDSTIVATPWRGDESVARVIGPDIIFPDGVTVTLEDGVPSPGPLELVPNDGTWCWRITVLAQRPRARLTRYVTVPDQPTVEFGDLIEVDPHTFAPSAVAVAAWEAVIAQVEAAMATIQDGTDGREVELGVSATHIQWRYVGEPAWTDLIALEELKGDPGDPGAPGAPGLKVYASTADVDAINVTEQGILRLPNQAAMQAFFGPAGAQLYFGADVFIQSALSDNYGSGFPPGAIGRMQQAAYLDDGYGSHYVLIRTRGWNSTTQTWNVWNPWALLPYPLFRPSTTSLFRAGSAVDGSNDGFSLMYEPAALGTAQVEHAAWNYIPQLWATWFGQDFELEKGKLKIKSAGFEFDGILDGARTDVGTVSFAARAGNLQQQSNRVEAVAAAAGVNAVTGFSIPVGLLNRFGIVFHATFSMQAGITANTKLLCGLVNRADLALAMGDNDPSAMQNFFAAGYGSADAGVSVYQKATAALSTGASTRPPSTSANQLIDFKAWVTPNSGTLRYILAIRTSTNVDRIFGNLGNNPANSLPLDFFIRASAGGSSATPRLALHRLRVGGGIGDLAGW